MLGIYVWLVTRINSIRAHSERGAAAVEYGLLVALIAVAIVATVGALGSKVNSVFCAVVENLPFEPTTCGTEAPTG